MGGVGVGRSGLGCEYCVHHHWAPICPASPPSIHSSASHDLSSVPHSCLSLAGTISLTVIWLKCLSLGQEVASLPLNTSVWIS